MTSHEDRDAKRQRIIENATKMTGATIRETDDSTVVAGIDDDENSWTVELEHTGYMTMGQHSIPGKDLGEGPIFGAWPGIGLIGEVRDPEGKPVDTKVLGNEGITVLLPNPESVVNLVQAALSICMTSEQVDTVVETIEILMQRNMESHTPSRLVEQMHLSMEQMAGNAYQVSSVNQWVEDDTTGLMSVAVRAGVPQDELIELNKVLSNQELGLQEKMESAKAILTKHGVNLIDMSKGVPPGVLELLRTLNSAGALEKVADIGDLSAMGISLGDLLDTLPPEQAAEFRKKISDQLEGKEEG